MGYISNNGGGAIGIPISGGTNKSVLYIDSTGKLAQENSDFYYDPAVNKLHVTGTDAADPSFSPIDGMGMYNVGSGMLGFSTSSGFKVGIDSSGRIGVGTSSPTHSITLPSTSTGFAHYNTTDQVTNYERVVGDWSANEYRIYTLKGGTGATRALRLGAGTSGGNGEVICGFGGSQIVHILTNSFTRMSFSTTLTNYFPIVGDATYTTAGTTGNQTINKPVGSVNFAAAATTLTVTNSMCTANSIVTCVVMTNDATATIKNVVPASGSFVITLAAAATAETRVGFILG